MLLFYFIYINYFYFFKNFLKKNKTYILAKHIGRLYNTYSIAHCSFFKPMACKTAHHHPYLGVILPSILYQKDEDSSIS